MGQVFFGDAIARPDTLKLLKAYVAHYQARVEELNAWYMRLEADLDDPNLPERLLFRIAPLEHAIRYAHFDVAWYTEMMHRVEANQNAENKGLEKWDEQAEP